MLGEGYRDGCTPWGRAHNEPTWVLWLNRLGIVVVIYGGVHDLENVVFGGVTCCVATGIYYLYRTARFLRT